MRQENGEPVSQPQPSSRGSFSRRNRKMLPWLPLVLLLGSIYAFWIYPHQRGEVPVKVIFEGSKPISTKPFASPSEPAHQGLTNSVPPQKGGSAPGAPPKSSPGTPIILNSKN